MAKRTAIDALLCRAAASDAYEARRIDRGATRSGGLAAVGGVSQQASVDLEPNVLFWQDLVQAS